MKMRESNEMELNASKANGGTGKSKPVMETVVSSNVSKSLMSDDSVGFPKPGCKFQEKEIKKTPAATTTTRVTNQYYSAPRSAKKRARVDSSISYSDNISMEENTLDSENTSKFPPK